MPLRANFTFTKRQKLILLVLCGGLFLDALDTSLVIIALPSIQESLGLSEGVLQWIIAGYTVAYGGMLLLGGRIADLFGRKKIFIAAMALFIVMSLLGGIVSNDVLLIASRILKGIAAAFIAPAALAMLVSQFREGEMRNKALGIYATTGASGYTAGLIFSGILTQINWHLVFIFPAVVGLVLLALAFRVLQPDKGQTITTGYDIPGALAITGAVMGFIYMLVQTAEGGLSVATTLIPGLVAVLLFGAFIVIERRSAYPIVPFSFLRSRDRQAGQIAALSWAIAIYAWQFAITMLLQDQLRLSPLLAGLAVVPLSLGVVITSQFASKCIAKIGRYNVLLLGLAVQAAGILWALLVGVSSNYFVAVFPSMVLGGIGCGLAFTVFNILGLSGASEKQQGLAGGIITAVTQVGIGIGTAVGAIIISTVGRTDGILAYQVVFIAGAVSALIGIVAVLGYKVKKRRAAAVSQAQNPNSYLPSPGEAD